MVSMAVSHAGGGDFDRSLPVWYTDRRKPAAFPDLSLEVKEAVQKLYVIERRRQDLILPGFYSSEEYKPHSEVEIRRYLTQHRKQFERISPEGRQRWRMAVHSAMREFETTFHKAAPAGTHTLAPDLCRHFNRQSLDYQLMDALCSWAKGVPDDKLVPFFEVVASFMEQIRISTLETHEQSVEHQYLSRLQRIAAEDCAPARQKYHAGILISERERLLLEYYRKLLEEMVQLQENMQAGNEQTRKLVRIYQETLFHYKDVFEDLRRLPTTPKRGLKNGAVEAESNVKRARTL